MVTNHHVFPVADLAEFQGFADDPTMEFGYEFDVDGRRTDPVVFSLMPGDFLHTDKDLDLAIVAVAESDRTGRRRLSEQGYLVLNGTLGKAGLGDYATIIQHPDGREKQIALRNNEIIDLTLPEVIIYKSDTSQGSSGAPVFNNEWQVIALHSAGVPKKDGQGNYLDKDNQIIEVVNGKVDSERIVWLSNRGIRVSRIMEHMKTAGAAVTLSPFVQFLLAPAYTDARPFAFLSRPTLPLAQAPDAEAAPPAPAPAPAVPTAPVSIHISFGGDGRPAVSVASPERALADAAAEQEKKFEDEQDFSQCEGFQDEFMGVRIPMPVPSAALRAKLAFRTDSPSSYTLKYHHFSSIHHAVRRVPVVSGINVHGKYRYAALGDDTRSDRWYRDNRLDYDAQLDDDWYASSGFDKGHLARREDAEWGTTMAKAKLAADMTCSYANAIPQVPALNRAKFGYHGLWGQLEAKLLEAGVENEAGTSAHICVFNGPLFDADDPVYKSVQVALRHFKVVVWFDGSGTLRTTAFRLSQEQLVGEIDFEALRFDEIFKTYQCPLDEIEALTGLDFHQRMRDSDTSAGNTSEVNEIMFERLRKPVRRRRP